MCIIFSLANANNSLPTSPRNVVFKIKIKAIADNKAEGYLNQIDEISLHLSQHALHYGTQQAGNQKQTFNFSNLYSVQVTRKGPARKGVIIGSITGDIVAAILGKSLFNRCSPGDFCIQFNNAESLFAGITLVSKSDSLLGLLISATAYKSYRIKGEKKKFEQMRTSLLEKVYGK